MANNLRIIFDNAADRTSSLTATAGPFPATNLQTDIKSQVFRSSTTSATITAAWTAAQTIGAVILPFCNLTSLATIRVRCYTNVGDTLPVFDSGTTPLALACPAAASPLWTWGGMALGSNSFSYGGGSYARYWLATQVSVKQVVIDIADTSNPAGYIEMSRLVTGAYWSPKINMDYGAPISIVDTSKQFRNDAGDLKVEIGARHRKQSISLSAMDEADRSALWNIAWGNGLVGPILISLYPNDPNSLLEQVHQIYGRLVAIPGINTSYLSRYTTQIEIEEI